MVTFGTGTIVGDPNAICTQRLAQYLGWALSQLVWTTDIARGELHTIFFFKNQKKWAKARMFLTMPEMRTNCFELFFEWLTFRPY